MTTRTFYVIAATRGAAMAIAVRMARGSLPVVYRSAVDCVASHDAQPRPMQLSYHPWAVMLQATPTGLKINETRRLDLGEKP